jgi:hypothetical protein
MAKTGINYRPKAKRHLVSPEARTLIRATLRQCHGSERKAAALLKLANNAQLGRMLRGEISETPAMKAAVIRAKARAKRAFLMQHGEPVCIADLEKIRKTLDEIRWALDVASSIIGVAR